MGFNDLATVNPVLASEVSPDSEIKATEIMLFSKKEAAMGMQQWP